MTFGIVWLRLCVTQTRLGLCSRSDSVQSTKPPTAEYGILYVITVAKSESSRVVVYAVGEICSAT